MNPLTLVQATQLAALNALTATGGVLASTALRLATAPARWELVEVLADITEATFSGYAAVTGVTFGPAYIAPDGNPHITATGEQFTQTASTVGSVVTFWYLTNTAGTVLVGGGTFPRQIIFNQAGDGVVVAPDLTYGG